MILAHDRVVKRDDFGCERAGVLALHNAGARRAERLTERGAEARRVGERVRLVAARATS